MKKLLIILFLFICLISQATNYYVKNSGSDAANGLTNGTAWKTIAKVNTITFNPGDNIYFNRGDTWKEILVPKSNGSVGLPVTYSAYGVGTKPIIIARDTVPGFSKDANWTQSGDKWYMTFTADVYSPPKRLWINGVEKERPFTTTVTAARPWYWASDVLYIYSATNPGTAFTSIMVNQIRLACIRPAYYPTGVVYNTFSYLDLQYGYYSVRLESCSNITIDSCNLSGHYGLSVAGYLASNPNGDPANNGVVKNCNFDALCTMTGGTAEGKYTEDGINLYRQIDNWEIYNNTFKNWGHSAVYLYNPTEVIYTISNVNVHNNYFTAPDTDYGRGLCVDYITGTGNKFYNNIIYNTPTLNQINGDGFMFYNNIIDVVRGFPWGIGNGLGAAGLDIIGYSSVTTPINIKIYNNVISNCVGSGFVIFGNAGYANKQNNEVTNNIIFNCNTANNYQIEIKDDATILNNTFKNNLLYKAGVTDLVYYGHSATNDYLHTIAEFNAENGTASDVISGNIGGDPLFISTTDFHLQVNSPAKDAGLNVGLTIDYIGHSVPQNLLYDIGAYEYGTWIVRSGGKIVRSGGKIVKITQ